MPKGQKGGWNSTEARKQLNQLSRSASDAGNQMMLQGLRARIIRANCLLLEVSPHRMAEVIKELRDLADEMDGEG